MTPPLAALTARLDEAFAWLEVHPPAHPATRAAAGALTRLRAVVDAGLTPMAAEAAETWLAWTEAQTAAMADGLPGEDGELADLVRLIGTLWRELAAQVTGGPKRRRGPSPAPVFAIVGTRPVRSVPLLDGGLSILGFDWASGRLVPDMSQLDAVLAPADRDVDIVDVVAFYDTVSALRRRHDLPQPPPPTVATARDTVIDWLTGDNAAMPYRAEVDGDEWTLGVNDWPAAPTVYTLFVNGREVFGFDGWPDTWSRP